MKRFVLVVLLSLASMAKAGGLATELGEVVIQNLEPGKTYNLTEIASLPLVVINTGDSQIDLIIEPQIPTKVKEGYESIPDIKWVKVSQDTFTLSPNGRAITDIIISIPDKKDYLGKCFHVDIWSHAGASPGMISLGLISRILFTITPTFQKIKKNMEARGMGFNLLPYQIKIKGVKGGRVKNVKDTFKIENLSDSLNTYSIESLSVKESLILLEEGYLDTPNPNFLIFSERSFSLAPGKTKEVKMWVAFPDNPTFRKKDYMFVVLVKSEEQPLGLYSRVYVRVE